MKVQEVEDGPIAGVSIIEDSKVLRVGEVKGRPVPVRVLKDHALFPPSGNASPTFSHLISEEHCFVACLYTLLPLEIGFVADDTQLVAYGLQVPP